MFVFLHAGFVPFPTHLPSGITLDLLSVVADAVTTPFEAIRRSGLGRTMSLCLSAWEAWADSGCRLPRL